MYKRVFLKSVSLILVISFLLGNAHGVTGFDDIPQNNASYSFGEEKILSNATLESNFIEGEVIVALTRLASSIVDFSGERATLKSYSPNDFLETNCSYVEDLTLCAVELLDEELATVSYRNLKELGVCVTVFDLGLDIHKFNRILRLELEEKSKQSVLDAINELEKREDVLYAGPNYIYSATATRPNDPYYTSGNQWAIDNLGLPFAWDVTTGSSSVRVGVLDSGIQWNHTDLQPNISTASPSLHRDCTSNPITIVANPTDTDPDGHGTHVAGIIGASTNTSTPTGVAGTCWNVSLISLKVLTYNPSTGKLSGDTGSITRAVIYANSYWIPILNLSSNTQYDDGGLFIAIDNYYGLFVCSAGNDGTDNGSIYTPSYPANYRLGNLISVGAIQNTRSSNGYNEIWPGSNFGATTVDIFAPGAGLYSTVPTSVVPSGYRSASGTSGAAPYVTGVAALLLAKNPSYKAFDLKRIIMQTSTNNPNLNGYCIESRQLDAYSALISNPYSVSVLGSYANPSGTGFYIPGSIVTINAGSRIGYVFSHWAVSPSSVTLFNQYSPTTIFSMPNTTVKITAHWTETTPVIDMYAGDYYAEKVLSVNAGQYKNAYVSSATGGTYVIQTFGTKDAFLALYSLGGTLLASNDNSGYGYNALISYNLAANTYYELRVSFVSPSESGAVKLAVMTSASSYASYSNVDKYDDYSSGMTIYGIPSSGYVDLLRLEYSTTSTVTYYTDYGSDYLCIIDPRSTDPLIGDQYNSGPWDYPNLYCYNFWGCSNAELTKQMDANVEYLLIFSYSSGYYLINTY